MQSKSGHTMWVSGIHHHLKFVNGFQVYGWTAAPIKRSEAVKELIEIANGGTPVYDKTDVENYWTTKK